MTAPVQPGNAEAQRLAVLQSHAIMDTAPEEAFDQLARLAAQVCAVPMALVNFVDARRQWFKAAVGVAMPQTDRAVAFCTHWLDGRREVVEVPDARQHPLFKDNPLVLGPPHIRFYACAPLVTPDGFALGTLVVMDTQPRTLDDAQRHALQSLASQAMAQLQLRRQHEALRLSEERFHLVADATADTVWDWDVRSGNIWWSGSFRALWGMAPDQPMPDADAWAQRVHPADRQRVVQALRAATQDQPGAPPADHDHDHNAWQAEYRMLRDDGRSIWVLDRGFVLRDAQGRALRMVGGMKDISADKHAHLAALDEAQVQAELVQVQQKMSSLELRQSALLELVAQAVLRITGATDAVVELNGVARACAGPGLCEEGSTPSVPLLAHSPLWSALQAGQTVQCNDTQAPPQELDGSLPAYPPQVRAVLATPLRINARVAGALQATSAQPGAFSARHAAHLQILSESLGALLHLRQVAARLGASEQQYRLLFDAHPQPMWVYAFDDSLRILAVNQATVALYGYTEAQLLAMSMTDLWLPQERAQLRAEVMAIPLDGGCDALQHRHLHQSGAVLEVEIWSRGTTFNGQPARQIMATDITERLRAQRELARMGRAQQLLGACNEAMVRATSEQTLLQDVCRIAVDIGGYRLGWVGFAHDDAQKTIEPVAHAGANDGYLETLNLSWSATDPRGQGPSGATVRTGQPVIVQDVRSEPAYADLRDRMLAHGFHGVISLPLRQDERTFGLLYLYAPEVLHISPEEARLLQRLANDLAFGITSLRARKEQQRLQASVLKVAAAVSATTGTEFFIQLARNMAEVLGAQLGCVARLLPRKSGQVPRITTLAVVQDGHLLPNDEYSLGGTPSLVLLTQRQHVVRHSAVQRYPQAALVKMLNAQAYAGLQLSDTQGQPLGMVFVLFRQPLQSPEFVMSTLQIFAARASTEIDRQLSDARIRHQASLLDKAQDAIVVRDLDHRITFWNQGAERLYGWARVQALGQSMPELLRQQVTHFQRATDTVLTQGEWTGELVQHHRDGQAIDLEGRWTLVRSEDGQPESILAIHTDIRQRKATEREIQRLAFFDSLTGLPNRTLLMERMHQALATAQRNHEGGALLFIDLDNFKTLNDTLGHDKGDLLLQQVAQRLNTCVRGADTVARLGGDEFVVMLEGLSPEPEALALTARSVGEKILTTLAAPYALAGYQYRSTPSIGIAPFCCEGTTSVGDLLRQADLAMYQAKTAGRNTLRFFDPHMQAVVTARAALESDLRQALAQDQFLLYYQPQVDRLGQYIGVEALVRWLHPERGLVTPVHFIPLAEETGLVLTLGRWVLHTACQVLAQWRSDPALQGLSMAVNVSSRQFRHAGFVDDVAHVLQITGAPAHLLKLELTESLLVEDMETTIATMTALGALGVGFSLDDFGTGYSSLSYLKLMPLHQLKIDQSFVRDLLTDPNDAAIVNTIIGLSRSLGLTVIAEGVETTEQRDALLHAGCPAFQGYLFSKPLPQHLLEPLLRRPVR